MDFEKYTEKQDRKRKEMCGVDDKNFFGGCARFEGMNAKTLQLLVDKGYADPEDNTNGSTTLGEYLEFMKAHPRFKAHGYIIDNNRDDRRITIEGLEAGKTTIKEMCDFIELDRMADEFEVSSEYCRSWWD